MRSNLKLVAVLSTVLALGLVSFASATGSGGNDGKSVRHLYFESKPDQEVELDLGEEGFGIGDRFAFSEDLVYDGDEEWGRLSAECVFTNVQPDDAASEDEITATTLLCNGAFELPAGQITVQGAVEFSVENEGDPFVIAVTGGTRAYKAAHGEVRITEREDGSSRYKVTLIR